jgi:hypothetical protein
MYVLECVVHVIFLISLFDVHLSVIDLSNGAVVAQVRYDYKIYM